MMAMIISRMRLLTDVDVEVVFRRRMFKRMSMDDDVNGDKQWMAQMISMRWEWWEGYDVNLTIHGE